jgi:2-methylcitrate dehydratase PrpD
VTRGIADAVARFSLADLPPAVGHETERTLFNVLAVAVGASRNPGVEVILRAAREAGGAAVAPIVGRPERADAHFAALANGFASHVDDYDDTHLQTVIHPAAAIAATVLALAPSTAPTGSGALRAFVLGCEVQLRIGVAISPGHYDDGWHITGTCGTLGAAVSSAALLGLDAARIEHALGIAASSALGQREAFGRMTKAFHAGKAAANGIRAARLAAAGFTAPAGVLERRGGFADAMASHHQIGTLDVDLRERFELAKNTYKPYPCGIVAHPAIDAAVALAPAVGALDVVVEVIARCHHLVPELMGNATPADGLQARFSAVHGIAMGLRDGRVGLPQYADEVVNAPEVRALRDRVRLAPDERIARDEARLTVRRADGSVLEEHVLHARGSLERPLTDEELLDKARALVEPVLPGRTGALRRAVAELAAAPDLRALIAAVTP